MVDAGTSAKAQEWVRAVTELRELLHQLFPPKCPTPGRILVALMELENGFRAVMVGKNHDRDQEAQRIIERKQAPPKTVTETWRCQ